jgi:hypothetical protein
LRIIFAATPILHLGGASTFFFIFLVLLGTILTGGFSSSNIEDWFELWQKDANSEEILRMLLQRSMLKKELLP